jgi:hypothetical protein
MNGQADNPEDRRTARRGAEFIEDIHGILAACTVDAELAALDEGSPWHLATAGDASALVAAYRQARLLAEDLRTALDEVGIHEDEVPGVVGSIDADGRPIVSLGTVSAVTARRLVCMVSGRPSPPAGEGKDRAA